MRHAISLSLENSTYFIDFFSHETAVENITALKKKQGKKTKKNPNLLKYEKYYALRAQCDFTAFFSKVQRDLFKNILKISVNYLQHY